MVRSAYAFFSTVLFLTPCAAQSEKLSLPLPTSMNGTGIGAFELAPDDSCVVYLAREVTDARAELHCRSLRNATTRRLTGTIPPAESVTKFYMSPDSTRVFFLTSAERPYQTGTTETTRLYSARLDGSSIPKPLAEADWGIRELKITPDGTWIVYERGEDEGLTADLFSVPTDGHRDPIRLVDESYDERTFQVANGNVVFLRVDDPGVTVELFRIAVDGTGLVRLSAPLPSAGDVMDFKISPDGTRVVYRADQVTNNVAELFSVPILGTATPRRLNGAIVAGGGVRTYELSSDSTRVAYIAEEVRAHVNELFVAPIAGTGISVKVSGSLVAGGNVQPGARFSADSSGVVYRADALRHAVFQLFSAPADASHAPILVSGPSVSGSVSNMYFQSKPHIFLGAGNTVVYSADTATAGVVELFSAPLDGSRAPLKLSGQLAPAGDVIEFEVNADGSRAFYRADVQTDQAFDLYAVPVNGAQPPSKINLTSHRQDTPFDFSSTADGTRVLFVETSDLNERPSDASAPPTLVNGPLGPGRVHGQVRGFIEDPESERVVYAADQDAVQREELVSVETNGALDPLRLGEPATSSDSITILRTVHGRIVYVQPTSTGNGLFSVPIDGSAAPVSLSSPFDHENIYASPLSFTPDGNRIVFEVVESSGPRDLYSALVDGSAAPVRVSGALGQNVDLNGDVAISADGARVLYCARVVNATALELYVAPIDGSVPPLRLSGALVAGGNVDPYIMLCTQDSRFVLYIADAELDERFELYAVALDGSSPPRKLSGALVPGGDVSPLAYFTGVAMACGGQRVIFRADALTDGVIELFSVPLDGSSAPTRLSTGGGVLDFSVTADGSNVVYRSGRADQAELSVVPALGGVRPRRLNSPLVAGGSVSYFQIAPHSTRVVYEADQVTLGQSELFAVALDAPNSVVRLNASLPKQGGLLGFGISSDGRTVVYEADRESNNEYFPVAQELDSVPIDGHRPARRVIAPLPAGRMIESFWVSADGARVFYIADQDEEGIFELYQAFIGPQTSQAPRPR